MSVATNEFQLDKLDENFIIKEKCNALYDKIFFTKYSTANKYLLVEDTSLYLDAFNGFPGPYIKDMYEKIGSKQLYELVKNINPNARFECKIAYKDDVNQDPFIFTGVTEGTIVKPRGSYGFDFDNIFEIKPLKRTFAELKEIYCYPYYNTNELQHENYTTSEKYEDYDINQNGNKQDLNSAILNLKTNKKNEEFVNKVNILIEHSPRLKAYTQFLNYINHELHEHSMWMHH